LATITESINKYTVHTTHTHATGITYKTSWLDLSNSPTHPFWPLDRYDVISVDGQGRLDWKVSWGKRRRKGGKIIIRLAERSSRQSKMVCLSFFFQEFSKKIKIKK
jgi:hypothetical protein